MKEANLFSEYDFILIMDLFYKIANYLGGKDS